MKSRLKALLLLAMLSTAVDAQTSPGATWDSFHLAIVRSDRAAAASLLAADVQIFESGFVERSREEYLAHHFDADAGFAKSVTRTVTRRTERTAGAMAVVFEETETGGSYQGQPIKLIGTETAVLRLDGETWRIVHIHWSSRKPGP